MPIFPYYDFAHNHACMIICKNNDYSLIFNMLFFKISKCDRYHVFIFEKISQI